MRCSERLRHLGGPGAGVKADKQRLKIEHYHACFVHERCKIFLLTLCFGTQTLVHGFSLRGTTNIAKLLKTDARGDK